jgi:hypothetical protein
VGISFAPPFGGMKFGLCADQYTSVLHSKLIQWTPHIILCGTVICMFVCVSTIFKFKMFISLL